MFKRSEDDDRRQKMYTPAGDRVPGYSVDEIESIKVALNRKLGPEFISKRKGPGFSSVQYLEGWKAINLANDIFGFNGWNTELKEYKVDYIDDKNGAISMGLSCIVRIVLKDGTFHEDIGYGSIENCRSKAMAFEKCKKEACTDGMKRALRQFGNALGNCLYDKDFLQNITKVSMEPNKFDENALMRRSVTVPKIENTNNNLNKSNNIIANVSKSFPPIPNNIHDGENTRELLSKSGSPSRTSSKKQKSVVNEEIDEYDDDFEDSYMFSDDLPAELINTESKLGEELPSSDFGGDEDVGEVDGADPDQPKSTSTNSASKVPTESEISANSTTIPEHVTFVSATSADTIQQDPSLQEALKFDISYTPKTITRSSLINHSKSLPVKKSIFSSSKESSMSTTLTDKINDSSNKENKIHKVPSLVAKGGPVYKASIPYNSKQTNDAGILSLGMVANSVTTKRSFGLPPDKLQGKRLKK
ncbi:hypothetical protein CANINC_000453 [Pichia inconspicua]|uniref:DNA repair and recombination protein RAD52 n=1 Tax=Pichia inconspicua TaxID=52247 RepID=A0A4T0X616_9ASCO|nr:hypothetical protein CANINC_000453 [[Candida] inconspicua]